MKKWITGTVLVSSLVMAGGDIAPVKEVVPVAPIEVNDEIKQSFELYGWLPSLDGSLKYNLPDNSGTGESDIISKLDSVFMGAYSIRKNQWSFLADVQYVKFADSQSVSQSLLNRQFTLASEQELTTWIASGYVGYALLDDGIHTLDAIAGLRYLSLGADISVSLNNLQRGISPSAEFYDGVVGVQGEVNFNESWYLPYHFDVGAGDSDLTAQASIGIGYRFGWVDAILSYRYLYYDEGTEALVNTLDAYGPQIGVKFHF